MGYLTSKQTKQQLVDEIKSTSKCTEWSLVGNHLWGLFPVESATQENYIIVLYLIKSFGDGEYGYKTFDESAHPYYYICPLKFLKKAVVLHQEWRNLVMKHHQKNRIEVGDKIELKNCKIPYVIITKKIKSKLYGIYNNIEYRIPKSIIA
jgi:hypothetical protein